MSPMEEMVLALMPPQDVPAQVAILGKVLAKTRPEIASSLLVGAVANLIGNIPDDFWEEMVNLKIPPCKREGCTCHLVEMEFIKALLPVRAFFEKTNEASDQGKGFSA